LFLQLKPHFTNAHRHLRVKEFGMFPFSATYRVTPEPSSCCVRKPTQQFHPAYYQQLFMQYHVVYNPFE